MDILVKHNGQLEVLNVTAISDDCTALQFPDSVNHYKTKLIEVTDFLNEYEVISVMRDVTEEDINKLKSGKI